MSIHHWFFNSGAADTFEQYDFKSVQLDRTDKYFEAPHAASLNISNASGAYRHTIAAWIKVVDASASTNEAIVTKGYSGASDGLEYWFHTRQSSSNFYIEGFVYGAAGNSDRKRRQSLIDTVANLDGQWHFVAMIWDANGATASDRMRLYWDGVEVSSYSVDDVTNGNTWAGTDPFHVASLNTSGGTFYNSGHNISEVMMWDKVLSDAEILELYGPGKPIDPSIDTGNYVSSANLTHHTRFGDDPSDDDTADTGTIVDQTANSNDLTPRNTDGNEIVEDAP